MTLLATEIHNHDDPSKALIVFAADRCISKGNACVRSEQKIYKIDRLNAGIGFFGLAEIDDGRSMAAWLSEFMNRGVGNDLKSFAGALCDELNQCIRERLRSVQPSGFHIGGFRDDGAPEFWYVRNIADDRKTLLSQYEAREEFQQRDVKILPRGAVQIYRNGDICAHITAWESIDEAFGGLRDAADFRSLKKSDDYADWVRFKFQTIARFYHHYCTRSIIAEPIDVFVITATHDDHDVACARAHSLQQSMPLQVSAEGVPLATDADGVARVASSRVTVDTVVAAFNEGMTPEEIVVQYPSLPLANVYSVIGYYLSHREDVESYLRSRQHFAESVRCRNEARFEPAGIRERLLSRRGQG